MMMNDSFNIKRWIENPDELLLIAGPCSVESREQFFKTSLKLSELHQVNILRGGIWKPRTRPNGFEGIGEEGLKWMKEISRETRLPVMTEVATPQHVELAIKYNIDALWIGARTTANPFSMQQLADSLVGTDIPVFIKNPTLCQRLSGRFGSIRSGTYAGSTDGAFDQCRYLSNLHGGL